MYERLSIVVAGLTAAMLCASTSIADQNITPPAEFQTTSTAAPSADYRIDWWSVNSGGRGLTADGYAMSSSARQAVVGTVAGDNYRLEQGYWLGGEAGAACNCGMWGDVNGDGSINPVDVIYIVNFVYKGLDGRTVWPECPRATGDVNCDNGVNPLDMAYYVQYVYKSQNAFCGDPCGP